MVQELLSLLPRMGQTAMLVAIVVALGGAGLWLFGSRYNRALMCLALVSVGAGMGLRLPHWLGWSLDGWASALGLAAILGIIGFVLHEFWGHVAQIMLLSLWAAAITWVNWHGTLSVSWPAFEPGTSIPNYLLEIWRAFPFEVRRIFPFTCGAALVAGAAIAIIWPRFSRLLFHSGAGASLMVMAGLLALKIGCPNCLKSLTHDNSIQVGIFAALVVVGMLWQRRSHKSRKSSGGGNKSSPHNRPSME